MGEGMITNACQSLTKKQQKEWQGFPRVAGESVKAVQESRLAEWVGSVSHLMKKTSRRYLFDKRKCGHQPKEMKERSLTLL